MRRIHCHMAMMCTSNCTFLGIDSKNFYTPDLEIANSGNVYYKNTKHIELSIRKNVKYYIFYFPILYTCFYVIYVSYHKRQTLYLFCFLVHVYFTLYKNMIYFYITWKNISSEEKKVTWYTWKQRCYIIFLSVIFWNS